MASECGGGGREEVRLLYTSLERSLLAMLDTCAPAAVGALSF